MITTFDIYRTRKRADLGISEALSQNPWWTRLGNGFCLHTGDGRAFHIPVGALTPQLLRGGPPISRVTYHIPENEVPDEVREELMARQEREDG